jgi:hypothetical protein
VLAKYTSGNSHRLGATVFAVILLALSMLPSPARATWSNDPAANLAIGNGIGEDVVPKIAGLPDGTCYVGWFDNASGNYDVRLQRLSPDGTEQWPHNGILVSTQAQDTWLTDWDLICDAAGNCVLVFSDIRTGNLDVQAYKITAAGDFAWGPNGINLSQNAAWEPTPAVCQASDGDYVFAWARYPDTGASAMMIQRVAPDGTLRYAVGGKSVISVGTEEPAFPDLEPSLNGDVLLMWVRDISSYMSPRHIRLQRFNLAGNPVWLNFTSIYDAAAIPMGYAPEIQADGAGGAICGWHASPVDMFSSFVQRVGPNGVEYYAHNGVSVSTDGTRHHIDPATAFNPTTGEFFVFWNERNSLQTQWGIYGQKISAAGARMWGNSGIALQPVNTIYKSYPRSSPLGTGAVCIVTDTPTGFSGDRMIAYRLDSMGANVWSTVPLLVATTQSGKSRLPFCRDGNGAIRIIWEDTRNGTPDVYGQSLNPDGSLGVNPADVQPADLRLATSRVVPNPFRGFADIEFVPGSSATAEVLIAGPDGRVVRAAEFDVHAGQRVVWRWDGRDAAGHEVPAGVYAYRIVSAGATMASGKAVLIR